MAHRIAHRKLGRATDHRLALFRNQVTDLLRNEKLITTEAKAKEVRGFAERMITLGKRGDLHARRQALGFVYDKDVVDKVFATWRPATRTAKADTPASSSWCRAWAMALAWRSFNWWRRTRGG